MTGGLKCCEVWLSACPDGFVLSSLQRVLYAECDKNFRACVEVSTERGAADAVMEEVRDAVTPPPLRALARKGAARWACGRNMSWVSCAADVCKQGTLNAMDIPLSVPTLQGDARGGEIGFDHTKNGMWEGGWSVTPLEVVMRFGFSVPTRCM